MIVQWNGEDLELKGMGNSSSWWADIAGGGRLFLVEGSYFDPSSWWATARFAERAICIEGPIRDTPQGATDAVRDQAAAAYAKMGVALHRPQEEPEAFPKWQDCPEFVKCLGARGYVLDADEVEDSMVMSAGLYLYMYELWQDGKRGAS